MIEYTLFNRLPAGSQIAILAQKGTKVAQRNHKEWTVTLYTLHNYFVESWVKSGTEIIGTFQNSADPLAILEPYLDAIEVQHLL